MYTIIKTGNKNRIFSNILIAIFTAILLMALVNINYLIGSLQSNITALKFISLISNQTFPKQDMTNMINVAIKDECQKEWLTGLLANLNGDTRARNQYWEITLECSSAYLPGIINQAKEDRSLAEFAVITVPDKDISWAWLASITLETEPEAAIKHYKKALDIRPDDGVYLYRLGEAYERVGKYYEAIEAFDKSCDYLNRGSDCYVRAGRIFENLGDIPSAIYYYRLSIFEGALFRADILESQMGQN